MCSARSERASWRRRSARATATSSSPTRRCRRRSRRGARIVAARGKKRPRRTARLAGVRRAQQGRRSGASADQATRAGGGRRHRARSPSPAGSRRGSRRPAAVDLHVLSPGARRGGSGRTHAAHARRAHDRRDRARVPDLARDDGPAARPRADQDPRREDSVRGARGLGAPRAPRRGDGRGLPDLQRGLRGDRRRRMAAQGSVRRSDPARPPTGRAGRRARHARARRGADRPARADAAPRRAPRHANRRSRRPRTARGSGSIAVGPRPDRRGTSSLRAPAALADRGGPYAREAAIAALHCSATRAADTDWPQIAGLYAARFCRGPLSDHRTQPRGRRGDGGGSGRRTRADGAAPRRLAAYHLWHAARADLLRRLGSHTDAAAAYREALARVGSDPERRFLERRLAEVSDR